MGMSIQDSQGGVKTQNENLGLSRSSTFYIIHGLLFEGTEIYRSPAIYIPHTIDTTLQDFR